MRQRWLTVFLIAIGGVLLASPVHTIGSEQATAQSEILVVRAVPALFPPIAAVAGESGTVVVEVKIKSDGAVAEATTVKGHKVFNAAAEKSAYNWAFNSVSEQVDFRVARLTFIFRLFPKPVSEETLLPVFMPPYSVEVRGTPPTYPNTKDVDPPMNPKPKR
jgi:TonB family protein